MIAKLKIITSLSKSAPALHLDNFNDIFYLSPFDIILYNKIVISAKTAEPITICFEKDIPKNINKIRFSKKFPTKAIPKSFSLFMLIL